MCLHLTFKLHNFAIHLIVKKISSILFLLIYLSALTGWSADIHYCGDKIASIALFTDNHDKDCCCNKKKCDCCSDQKVVTKIHKVHESQSNIAFDFKLKFQDFTTFSFKSFPISNRSNSSFTTHINHIPPLISKQPVYLRNMVFLI